MRKGRCAAAVLALWLLVGCTQAGGGSSLSLGDETSSAVSTQAQSVSAPDPSSAALVLGRRAETETYTLLEDVAYAQVSASQRMDIAFPVLKESAKQPVVTAVLFVHGGSWRSGDKGEYLPRCTAIAEEGAVAATMNYRMLDEDATCEDMLRDIGAALGALGRAAARQGMQLKGVVLMGPSAGAQLTLLYAYRYGAKSPVDILLCVGQCSPVDFTLDEMYEDENYGPLMLECASGLSGLALNENNWKRQEETLQRISPMQYVSPSSPPTILAHGTQDFFVPYVGAKNLTAALKRQGVYVQLFTYPSSGHGLEADPDVDARFFAAVEQYCGIDVSSRG